MSLKQQMSIPSRGRETRSCQNGRTLMRGFTDVGRGRHSRRAAPTDLGPRGGGGRTSVELQPAISFPPYVGRSSHATQQRRCGHSQSRPAIRSSLASSGDVSSDISLKRQCERTVLLPHRPFRPCDQTEDASSSRFEARSPTLAHPDIVRQQPPREVFTYSPRVEPAVTGTDSDPAVRTNWAGAFCPRRSCSVLVGNSKLLVFVTSAVTRR